MEAEGLHAKKRKRVDGEGPWSDDASDWAAQAARGRVLLNALLVIPQGELDDTHFEKLQSRLISFCQGPPQLFHAFLQVGAVETITRGVKEEDFRIVSVCWRLLGKVCQSSGTGLERLLSAHAPLFGELLAQAHSAREPLVRDSALHCLLGLTHDSAGLRWLGAHNERMVEVLLMDYRSESHFVADSAVALLSALVHREGADSFRFPASLNLAALLSDFLEDPTEDSDIKKRTLNLIDLLMQHDKGHELLQRHKILRKALPLLSSPDRLVRANLLELLEDVLKKEQQALLAEEGATDPDQAAVQVLHDAFWSLLSAPQGEDKDERRVQLRHRTSVQMALELGAVLALWPSTSGRELAASLFRVVAALAKGKTNCPTQLQEEHPGLADFVASFHTVFVLKALHMSSALVSLYASYADVLLGTEWMTWLLHLLEMHGKDEEGFAHGEDPRVIKAALDILYRFPKEQWLERLRQAEDAALVSPGFPSILCLIRQTTDRAVLMTALKLLQMLLAEATIQHTLLNNEGFGRELNTAIRALAVDWNWELRESATTFIASFFAPCGGESEPQGQSLSYALRHGLHDVLLEKLDDAESYVRAAALTTLSSVTHTERGWQAVAKSASADFVTLVTRALTDTEAFVKRAALELLGSWLTRRHTLQVLRTAMGKPDQRDALRIADVMQDFDWEVKLRGVRVLFALLRLAEVHSDAPDLARTQCQHHHQQQPPPDFQISRLKRRRLGSTAEEENGDGAEGAEEERSRQSTALALFLGLDGDRLLIAALKDYERLVRLEAASLLSPARDAYAKEATTAGQEAEEEEEEDRRMALFRQQVREVDLGAIVREAGPRRDEEEDDFLTRHINAPAVDPSVEQPFLDCPF